MNIRRAFKSFASDNSGQFAIIMSLMALPILAGVGLAIDYTYITQSKTRLRDSNDAAALYAASEYRRKGEMPAQAIVEGYLTENFNKADSELLPLVSVYKLEDGNVFLQSSVDTPMSIMQIFGHNIVNVAASSKVNVGEEQEIEIALVLDTTHSMLASSGSSSSDLDPQGSYFGAPNPNVNRLDALKFSASQFVNTMFENDAGKGLVRISVVPFADYVNVGTDKRGASWLTVPDDQASTGTSCYTARKVIGTENCREEMYTIDGAQIPVTVCDYIYGDNEEICYPTGASSWWGCVGSRNEPLNLLDSAPASKFTGIPNVWCAMPVQTLSDNKPATLTTIQNLSAYGNTYIPEGVMWGMRTLSKIEPFTEVKTPVGIKKVRKIMVLMTDGDNQAIANIPSSPTHRGLYSSDTGYAADRAKTDSWTLTACTEAKQAGIEMYTISFGTDISAQARSIVKSCAQDSEHYFDATDAEALSNAFSAIAAKVGGFFLAG